MKPVYAETIVVAIKYCGQIEWYVLDKELCFLDYAKLEQAYRKKGYEITVDNTLRFGIKVVNELTRERFLEQIKEYRVTSDELTEMLMDEPSYHERLAYNPSILIDFDERMFISHYAEPESFEYFVPDGWVGKYQGFEERIPKSQRYWLSNSGRNLIGGE